jgi:hypothetical protein
LTNDQRTKKRALNKDASKNYRLKRKAQQQEKMTSLDRLDAEMHRIKKSTLKDLEEFNALVSRYQAISGSL